MTLSNKSVSIMNNDTHHNGIQQNDTQHEDSLHNMPQTG